MENEKINTPEPAENVYLMQQAVDEINKLRQTIQLQKARLNMFDDVMRLINVDPGHGLAYNDSIDVSYKLQRFISENSPKAK